MATTRLGRKDNYAQSFITDAEANGWSTDLERVCAAAAEALGPGVFKATDFNLATVPGALELDITGGLAIVGAAGYEVPVNLRDAGTLRLTAAKNGLTGSATNYIYLKRIPTNAADLATWFTSNTTGTPPANTILVGSGVAGVSAFSSVNSNPTGRINFDDAAQARAAIGAAPADAAYFLVAADSELPNAINAPFLVGDGDTFPAIGGQWKYGIAPGASANFDVVLGRKAWLVDAHATKTNGTGGAGDTVQIVKVVAGVEYPVTDAMSLNCVQNVVVRASVLNHVNMKFDSGDIVRVKRTQVTNAACNLFGRWHPVA